MSKAVLPPTQHFYWQMARQTIQLFAHSTQLPRFFNTVVR